MNPETARSEPEAVPIGRLCCGPSLRGGGRSVNAVIVYESLTGNTRRASELIAAELRRAGIATSTCAVTQLDYQALSDADLVIVGTWTDGIFVVGQRPGRAQRLRNLP